LFSRLKKDLEVDVAVIGGGIVGVTTAFLLKNAGKKVALVEARFIGSGVTGHTTAHITVAHNLIFEELVKKFGIDNARVYLEANSKALEKIDELITVNKIECDFKRLSEYIFAQTTDLREKLKSEFEIVKKLNINVTYEDKAPLHFLNYGTINYHNQAQFHPVKYLQGLAKLIPNENNFVFEKTKVINIKEDEPCIVETETGTIKALDVIVATHTPIINKGLFYSRMEPYRSYVLAAKVDEKITEGMYDSIEQPEKEDSTNYIRTYDLNGETLILVGGESHRTGHKKNTKECYKNLEEYARTHFRIKSIDYYWSSQDNYSFDGIPFIGKFPRSDHLFLATAFNGWGMTNGVVASILIADQIQKKENPWSDFFKPNRFKLTEEGPTIAKEGFKDLKMLIEDRLLNKKIKELEGIEEGEGRIVEVEGQKIAISKINGKLIAVSAICTHLGCVVNWNNAEKSWDCPCHGSRFSKEGNVLHSPAVKELSHFDLVQ
jgi:glycine/D-amino acid oxidase-like deaminating enzyme/nitrite reductase/ring-hydroxylating ferredoxin subunit